MFSSPMGSFNRFLSIEKAGEVPKLVVQLAIGILGRCKGRQSIKQRVSLLQKRLCLRNLYEGTDDHKRPSHESDCRMFGHYIRSILRSTWQCTFVVDTQVASEGLPK